MKIFKNWRGHCAIFLAGIAIVTTSRAEFSNSDFFTEFPDQLDFPIIALQPLNQLVAPGGTATFEVVAENGPLTYQWLRNGTVLRGATNSTLTITNVSFEDVGLYSCNIAKELEIVPTRSAQLMLFTIPTTPQKSASRNIALLGSSQFQIFATAVVSSGSSGSCPGSYAGYVNFTKTVAQGWGWVPSSGITTHTATDTTRTDTKVQYLGKLGDSDCDQTSVAVPDPSHSIKYRFTIFFPYDVPTNSYSVTLDGFDP